MEKTNLPSTDIVENKCIEDCIFTVRGMQVMLDSDVAYFFKTSTYSLNRQMKRNKKRFPFDFCFNLSNKEIDDLRHHFGGTKYLSSKRRYNPYVYTEHGIIALAGVIKNDIAAEMSVEIVRKFIAMRNFIRDNGDMLLSLARVQNRQLVFENETNKKIENIIDMITKRDLPKQSIFLAGEYYDAYELITSFVVKANKSVVLIDPYCDSSVFTYLKNKKDDISITICKSSNSKLNDEEISIFTKQYGSVSIITRDDIHDRIIIIDGSEAYSLGASLNYMGKKTFAVLKIETTSIIDLLVKNLSVMV